MDTTSESTTAGDWVAPESELGSTDAPEDPRSPFGRHDRRPVRSRRGDAPRAVPLRPLTFMEILDHGFTVVRQRPRHAFTAAACVVVPQQLVLAVLLSRDFARDDFGALIGLNSTVTGVGQFRAGADVLVIGLLVVGPVFASLFASIALGQVVAAASLGRDLGVRPMVYGTVRRLPLVIVPWIVVHVGIVIATMLLVLPGLVVAVGFYLLGPVAGVESPGIGGLFSRPLQLARGKPWRLVAVWLLTGVVFGILTPVSAALPWLIAQFADPGWLWILRSVVAAVTALFTAAATGAISVVAYLDLRARLEGLDLELATRALRAEAT